MECPKFTADRVYERMLARELGYNLEERWDPRAEAVAKVLVNSRIENAQNQRDLILSGSQSEVYEFDGDAMLYLLLERTALEDALSKNN